MGVLEEHTVSGYQNISFYCFLLPVVHEKA